MAQSSNALQEPSMDELLASIREIIEENAGVSPADGGRQTAENGSRATRAEMHMPLRQASNDTGMPNLRQDIRVAAKNNAVPPVQDAMDALAERIGLRKAPVSGGQQEMVARPVVHSQVQPQPQRMAASREGRPDAPRGSVRQQAPKQKHPPEGRPDADDFEKGFRTDVERSAELLLRPYISQWLDEHFRQLFERILREEIQRFVQALRR